MNRDDIIAMAREAGLLRGGDGWTEPHRWGITELERFAALVAAAERDACAKVCDDWPNGRDDVYSIGVAIRARGEK
jgi:hypothetical protein